MANSDLQNLVEAYDYQDGDLNRLRFILKHRKIFRLVLPETEEELEECGTEVILSKAVLARFCIPSMWNASDRITPKNGLRFPIVGSRGVGILLDAIGIEWVGAKEYYELD